MVGKFNYRATTATQLVFSGNFVTMVRNLRREEGPRMMYRRQD
jgi:hypothetical protein